MNLLTSAPWAVLVLSPAQIIRYLIPILKDKNNDFFFFTLSLARNISSFTRKEKDVTPLPSG